MTTWSYHYTWQLFPLRRIMLVNHEATAPNNLIISASLCNVHPTTPSSSSIQDHYHHWQCLVRNYKGYYVKFWFMYYILLKRIREGLTLFRTGSQPTYLGRGGGGFRPPLSSRPVGPEGPQNWFTRKVVMYMRPTKKKSGRLPKNWGREPQFKISTWWLIWPKGIFQENSGSCTKIAVTRSFLGQST